MLKILRYDPEVAASWKLFNELHAEMLRFRELYDSVKGPVPSVEGLRYARAFSEYCDLGRRHGW